jgi:hypothetical protein
VGLSRYARDELTRFLETLDGLLQEPARLVVIGGSAIVLGYGGTASTSDIDTYESRPETFAAAANAHPRENGLRDRDRGQHDRADSRRL